MYCSKIPLTLTSAFLPSTFSVILSPVFIPSSLHIFSLSITPLSESLSSSLPFLVCRETISSNFSGFCGTTRFVSLSLTLLPCVTVHSCCETSIECLTLLFLSSVSVKNERLSALPLSFGTTTASYL